MILQHWLDDQSSTVFPDTEEALERHKPLFMGSPVFCCKIEGDTWEDCMQKYHDHMGWAPYVPGPHAGRVKGSR